MDDCPDRSGVNCGIFAGKDLDVGDLELGERFGDPFLAEALGLEVTLAGELGAEEPRWPPRPPFQQIFAISSRTSGLMHHFIPLPGSSVARATLWKDLFRERLCLIEFY